MEKGNSSVKIVAHSIHSVINTDVKECCNNGGFSALDGINQVFNPGAIMGHLVCDMFSTLLKGYIR